MAEELRAAAEEARESAEIARLPMTRAGWLNSRARPRLTWRHCSPWCWPNCVSAAHRSL